MSDDIMYYLFRGGAAMYINGLAVGRWSIVGYSGAYA
jgi:hypothetical protein